LPSYKQIHLVILYHTPHNHDIIMAMKQSEIKWTDKQNATIENRKNNILVSAAAGSGKTAVLVERIKQLIIFDEVSIDRILVVTFTKAAASEMKEKLLAALNKAVSLYPEKVALLRKQLDLINRANISTFHSFALEVIRKYFHIIQLDPGFKVCDQAESSIMKAEGMDRVFDQLFENGDPDFIQFIDHYGSPKNETQLKKNLIAIYDTIRSIPDSLNWLESAVQQTNLPKDLFIASPVMIYLNHHLNHKIRQSTQFLHKAIMLLEENGFDAQAGKCMLELNRLEEISECLRIEGVIAAGRLIVQYKGETIRVSKKQEADYAEIKELVKGLREQAKGIIKDLKEKFFSVAWSVYMDDMHKTYESGVTLFRIISNFDSVYEQIKRDNGLLDFSDIEHFAIKILENPVVALEYRQKFEYIFIDEYQDSNILQERIIDSIKSPNNVFMVGDIKQSIYKFRLAEPEIFQQKYNFFKSNNAPDSISIDLNQNFRSKPPIITAVNGIFSHLMEYDDDAALHGEIQQADISHYPVEMVIVDGKTTENGGVREVDEAIEELRLVELEAMEAAAIIKQSLGQPIYDSKRGEIRKLRQKDIVILMHGVKGKASTYYETLQDAEINCYVDDHTGYFDTIEITQFLDVLKVIDNFKKDISLIGVLHSPFFNFTVQDFIEIRSQCPGHAFYEAFLQFSLIGKNTILRKKIQDTLDKINGWKKSSKYQPINEFSWNLMIDSGFYAYMGGLPGGSLRQANLRIFVERARSFRNTGDGSIYGFIRYINTLAEKEVETEQAKIVGENDDVVRVMTIHKSKGLEFPMVIVASLGSRFIFDKIERTGVVHKDLGVGLTRVDPNGHWYRNTIIQHVIAAKKREEELAEAVRVLYVAFTRAMDKLILLSAVKDWEKEKSKIETGFKAETNYLGMLFPHLASGNIALRIKDREDLTRHVKETSYRNATIRHYIDDLDANLAECNEKGAIELSEARLSYIYPFVSDLMTKSKFSVSEIISQKNHEVAIGKPNFMAEKRQLASTEFGNIIHIVMEHIDPLQYHEINYIANYLEDLVNRELLLPSEKAVVKTELILAFAQSDIGKRLSKATNPHREEPFNFLYDLNDKQVMIQGIVDCWFEEGDKIVIIDYKAGSERTTMIDQYDQQLKLYRDGLEATLNKQVKETCLYFFGDGHCRSVIWFDNE